MRTILVRGHVYTLHIIHKLYERLGYGLTNQELLPPVLHNHGSGCLYANIIFRYTMADNSTSYNEICTPELNLQGNERNFILKACLTKGMQGTSQQNLCVAQVVELCIQAGGEEPCAPAMHILTRIEQVLSTRPFVGNIACCLLQKFVGIGSTARAVAAYSGAATMKFSMIESHTMSEIYWSLAT